MVCAAGAIVYMLACPFLEDRELERLEKKKPEAEDAETPSFTQFTFRVRQEK